MSEPPPPPPQINLATLVTLYSEGLSLGHLIILEAIRREPYADAATLGRLIKVMDSKGLSSTIKTINDKAPMIESIQEKDPKKPKFKYRYRLTKVGAAILKGLVVPEK